MKQQLSTYFLLSALSILSLSLHAAVPLRWTVETSRLQPVVFDAVRGETLALEASFQSYGKDFATGVKPYCICWQTNGMGAAWWMAPATVVSNRVSASFTPEMDPGATVVHGFIGSTGEMYRAAFMLRFRAGPGAVPNAIALPTRFLDLSTVEMRNVGDAPWAEKGTVVAATNETLRAAVECAGRDAANAETNAVARAKEYTDSAIQEAVSVTPSITTNIAWNVVSNVVTKPFVESLGIEAGIKEQTATNIANGAIHDAVTSNYLCTVAAAQAKAGEAEAAAKAASRSIDWMPTAEEVGALSVEWKDDSSSEFAGTAQFANLCYGGAVYLSGEYQLKARSLDKRWGAESVDELGVIKPFAYLSEIPTPTTKAFSDAFASKATEETAASASQTANSALAYGRGCFMYMNGSTNCYLSGTNYIVGAEGTNRTHFFWEEGMDEATVPCSMALWEIRDGVKTCVWDQRDWTVWYWNFKISQYRSEHDGRDTALRSLIAQKCPINWASYTACGLTNAASDTTWFDTPKITIAAGYAWQHQLTMNGVGYWGIQGNGCEIGGAGTNATLVITDWEGNEVLKIKKGSAMMSPISGESGVATGWDNGYMWYDMRCGVQPVGEFSADLLDTFVAEGSNCPAEVWKYEDRGSGVWRCYFRLKSGIQSTACFARFKVQTGTETTVEYANAPTITGGLRINGRKIAPEIPANAQVGDTITWKVVQ